MRGVFVHESLRGIGREELRENKELVGYCVSSVFPGSRHEQYLDTLFTIQSFLNNVRAIAVHSELDYATSKIRI
jgi:hypothetical protein